jgi:hypothetical protein
MQITKEANLKLLHNYIYVDLILLDNFEFNNLQRSQRFWIRNVTVTKIKRAL